MNQTRNYLVGSRPSLWNLDRTDQVLVVEGDRLRAEVISALAIIEWSMEEVEDVTIQETTQGHMEVTGVDIMVGEAEEVEVAGTGHQDLVEVTAEATAPEAVALILIGGIKFMFKWSPGICRLRRSEEKRGKGKLRINGSGRFRYRKNVFDLTLSWNPDGFEVGPIFAVRTRSSDLLFLSIFTAFLFDFTWPKPGTVAADCTCLSQPNLPRLTAWPGVGPSITIPWGHDNSVQDGDSVRSKQPI